jgi:hypothetical protein
LSYARRITGAKSVQSINSLKAGAANGVVELVADKSAECEQKKEKMQKGHSSE